MPIPLLGALLASVAGSAVSAGLGAALTPRPNTPNLAQSSRDAVLADLRTLPGRRAVEAAARLGTAANYPTGRLTVPTNVTQQQRTALLMAGLRPGDTITARQAEQLARIGLQPVAQQRTVDFTGLGDADVQGQLAAEGARNALELQQRYGADYIDAALEQERLADPEGVAARELLAEEIRRQSAERPERPVSDRLEAMMREELGAGRNVTEDVGGIADEVARRRAATGDAPGVNLRDELNRAGGDARERTRAGHTVSYLGSGQTPEDIGYRQEQQDIANMSAFLSGRTPQSQFGAMRNAQQGAAPVAQGPALPGQNPGTAGMFQNASLQNMNQQIQSLRSNVSPWFAGLSTLIQGANVAGQAGWQPLRS